RPQCHPEPQAKDRHPLTPGSWSMIEIAPSLLFVRRVLLLSLTSEETATESILRPSAQDDTLPSLVVAPFKTSRQEIGSSKSATLGKGRNFVLAFSTQQPES